jgi:hypothetical protein
MKPMRRSTSSSPSVPRLTARTRRSMEGGGPIERAFYSLRIAAVKKNPTEPVAWREYCRVASRPFPVSVVVPNPRTARAPPPVASTDVVRQKLSSFRRLRPAVADVRTQAILRHHVHAATQSRLGLLANATKRLGQAPILIGLSGYFFEDVAGGRGPNPKSLTNRGFRKLTTRSTFLATSQTTWMQCGSKAS